jgi:S1-C subfamily serine protease
VPGTAGPPRRLLGQNAYGKPVLREVLPLRGVIRRGDSGGPAVDRRGRVVAMMYAATRGERGGLAIPVAIVEEAAKGPLRRVRRDSCAG